MHRILFLACALGALSAASPALAAGDALPLELAPTKASHYELVRGPVYVGSVAHADAGLAAIAGPDRMLDTRTEKLAAAIWAWNRAGHPERSVIVDGVTYDLGQSQHVAQFLAVSPDHARALVNVIGPSLADAPTGRSLVAPSYGSADGSNDGAPGAPAGIRGGGDGPGI